MEQPRYLVCYHCKSEFLSADRGQLIRSRDPEARSYCSAVCQVAGSGLRRRRPLPYSATCPTCGTQFGSRYQKKFCSMKCYQASPEMQAMLKRNAVPANAARVLKATGVPLKPRVEVTCLNCGLKWLAKPSDGSRRYCSQSCYRKYMADRFDRWVASPEAIALPQCYDEFLLQVELPCLVAGCNWVGVHLGGHVNRAHGILAREFKRAAGFNVGSGLCTPAVSQNIAERNHFLGSVGSSRWARGGAPPPLVRGYVSQESREHHAKARALKYAEGMAPRVCLACGAEYVPNRGGVGSKFCTIPCREQFYKTNRRVWRTWMACSRCGRDFEGKLPQHRRVEAGKPVFCSLVCKQGHNGSFPKPKRVPGSENAAAAEALRNGEGGVVK
jgi:hypothetical protein